jgi:anthranilate phosphoribosyltransferase
MFIAQLEAGRPLDREQVRAAVADLVDEAVPDGLKADFLMSLSRKGEAPDEIASFALELRARCVEPRLDPELEAGEKLDVVGTGGDRLSTFNISTAVALLAAAAGVRVVKHGNRASTSLVGSADVVEELGIPFEHPPEDAVRLLRETGFAFFFAPRYHPAFKHIIPARKLCAARGQATIFNFLGPLLNPARPTAMLLGVARPELCVPLATVLRSLGVRRAMVVCGKVPAHDGAPERWLDELSTLGSSSVAEFYQDHALCTSALDPALFPVQKAALADLKGGDRRVNADIIRAVLGGSDRGPRRDAVLLNAAAALFLAGRAKSVQEGWETAAEVIDSGQARRKLAQLTGGGM